LKPEAAAAWHASELRGLRWSDINLNKETISVRQRADDEDHKCHPRRPARKAQTADNKPFDPATMAHLVTSR
jgi:integrase